MESLNEFLQSRRIVKPDALRYNSMNGGTYYIKFYDVEKLYRMIETEYRRYSRSSLGYLVELAEDGPCYSKFFLDIEDKSDSPLVYNERILRIIITECKTILAEIIDISADINDLFDDIFVSNNNVKPNTNIHILFTNLVVTKDLSRYIISRLKSKLNTQISRAIDDLGTKALRLLGVKKAVPKGIDCNQSDYAKQKGYYLPLYKIDNNFTFTKLNPNVTVESLTNFSIKAFKVIEGEFLECEYTKPISIRKNTLFYKCILDKTMYNPVKPKRKCFLSDINDIEKISFLKLLPCTVFGKHSYFRWLNIGKFCYKYNIGIELWRQLSYNGDYTKEETDRSTLSFWNKFDEMFEDADIDEITTAVLYKFCQEDMTRYTKSLANYKESEQEYKQSLKLYNTQVTVKVADDFYTLKNTTQHTKSKYVEFHIYKGSNTISLVKAPLGTGKTTSIVNYLKLKINKPVIWLSARQTFTSSLLEKIKEMGFVSYKQSSGKLISERVIVQYESLYRIDPEYYKDCILICDEIESVIIQMISSTNGQNKDINSEILKNLIKTSEEVIFADAFLSNRVIELCNIADPLKTINTHVYLPNKSRDVVVFESDTSMTGYNKLEQQLERDVKLGKKTYVFCSSKKLAKKLHARYQDSLLYSSDTNESTENVNIAWKDVNMIITTSKITIGIDCDKIKFDRCYAFISAYVLTRDVIQSLYRVREIKESTYVAFDNRAKQNRDSLLIQDIYKEYILKIQTAQNIINTWNMRDDKCFSHSLESFYNRVFISSLQERALNITEQITFALFLFKSQGYIRIPEPVIIPDEITLNEPAVYMTWKNTKKLDEETFKKLIMSKNDKSIDERAAITKFLLLKYTTIESMDDKLQESFFQECNESSALMSNIKHYYQLINNSNEQVYKFSSSNLVSSCKTIISKQLYEAFKEWQNDHKKISDGITLNIDDLRSLYKLTVNMNRITSSKSSYNENIKAQYIHCRINSFFSIVMPGVSIKKQNSDLFVVCCKKMSLHDFVKLNVFD